MAHVNTPWPKERRMRKEFDELPPEIQEQLLALDELADEDIDLSDVPEITDWSGAERGKFYPPSSNRSPSESTPT